MVYIHFFYKQPQVTDSGVKLAMDVFMTANNAVLNLNHICIPPSAFSMIFDRGGTVTDRCQWNEVVNSGLCFSQCFGIDAYTTV